MEIPDVQYARSGDVAIAYQVVGDGPMDFVWFRGMAGDLLSSWDQPRLIRHAHGLSEFGRVLMLDKRGTGLSDRVREVPTLETRMDDIRAVMDDVGSERAFLWTAHEGSRTAILFAATYPERTAGLVLLDPSVRGTATPDYPWAPSAEEWRRRLVDVRAGWGRRDFFAALLREWAPSVADDESFEDWFVGHMRRSLSPGAALSFFRTMMDADVSDVLATVRVPTLIFCRHSERDESGYVANRITGSRLVELEGLRGMFTWVDDAVHEKTMRETRQFVVGLSAGPPSRSGSSRRSCSRTSSARPSGPPSWATAPGATCSSVTTPSSEARSRASGGARSTPQATTSSRASKGPRARSAAPARCGAPSASSASRCGPASTRVSASSTARSRAGSRSTSGRGSRPKRNPARCWSPARSRISWPARASGSRTAASAS